MQFESGQTVIHPHHGPATVVEVFERSMQGRSRRYLGLQVHRTDLRVGVPVEKVEEVGLRAVFAEAQAEELLDVLRAPTGDQEELWTRRFKANQEKLRLGNLLTTAGVVRDLLRRQTGSGLSVGERDMLKHARRPVLAELALALSLTDEEVEELLDSTVLAGPASPEPLSAAG